MSTESGAGSASKFTFGISALLRPVAKSIAQYAHKGCKNKAKD
jgi:hypothetical protein